MLGRKFFKTKLCKLYQGGRCPRQNCSFAHGNAELRHASGSFNDRRDYRNGDLKYKLDRRHSPHRRSSPGRDARSYHVLRSQKPVSHDRGHSVSRSPVKRRWPTPVRDIEIGWLAKAENILWKEKKFLVSERRHRKKQHLDGESDDSGSFKTPNGAEGQKKEEKVSSYDDKDVFEEQLKKTQLDIEILDDHKSKLEMLLEEKVGVAHKLSSRIDDLEMQLNKEQENCKRITAKIKKVVRAHGRYSKAQEELKRSQARLHRLGDLLGSDISKLNVNEEDSSVNIASDGEPNDDKQRSPRNNELQNNTSTKKRQHAYLAASEEAQMGNLQNRKRFSGVITRSEKFFRAEGPRPQYENDSKEIETKKVVHIKYDGHKSLADEYKPKRGKISSPSVGSMDKVKGSEVGQSLPSTSMAAHAVDEFIEAIEMEEKSEAMETTAVDEIGAVDNKASFSYIPPPPVTQNAYKQYEGGDEDVDVEKVDTAEMLDIDINSEVDI